MAGDWIKMRSELQSHPKVVRILSAMCPQDVRYKTDKFRAIGGLHAVWSVFDTHSVDGQLAGYTPETMDHIIGWEGFSQAMMGVGWLVFDGQQTLTLPEFDEHNGQSAKRRAEDQKRKRNVRNLSGTNADRMRTECGLDKREEKIRDIKPPIVPIGDEAAILSAYHSTLPNCKRIEVLNPKRKKRLASVAKLARSVCTSQRWPYDPDTFWLAYFGECAKDPWMRGDIPYRDNPAWKQNLETLISEDRFAGVMDVAITCMRDAS